MSQDRTGHSESLTPLQAVSQLCSRLHSLNVSMCSGFSMHALIRVVRHLREAGRLRKLQMDELQVRVLDLGERNSHEREQEGHKHKGPPC